MCAEMGARKIRDPDFVRCIKDENKRFSVKRRG